MKELNDKRIQELLEKRLFGTETNNSAAQENLNITASSGTDQLSMLATEEDSEANAHDIEMYQLLFQTLKKEPDIAVPMNFSNKVITQISTEKAKANDFKFYLLIAMLGIFGFTTVLVTLSMLDHKNMSLLVNTVVDYKWIWISALLTIFLVQSIDRKISRSIPVKA